MALRDRADALTGVAELRAIGYRVVAVSEDDRHVLAGSPGRVCGSHHVQQEAFAACQSGQADR